MVYRKKSWNQNMIFEDTK